ncbi:MAG: hypothetical protein JEZ08_22300 [Clostridiales bacterium]|nr:hypothetical protein [Clostridiales bacterium]
MRTKKIIIKSAEENTKVIIMDKTNLQYLISLGMLFVVLLFLNPGEVFRSGFKLELDLFSIEWCIIFLSAVSGAVWRPFYKEIIILDQDYLKIQKKVFIVFYEQVYDVSKVKNMYVQNRKQKRRLHRNSLFKSEITEYFIRFEYEDMLKEFGRGISLKAGNDLITHHLSRFALSNDYDIFES